MVLIIYLQINRTINTKITSSRYYSELNYYIGENAGDRHHKQSF